MVARPKVPKVQYPDPPPPVPERDASAVASLAETQRKSFFNRGGRAGTFLNGGTGAGGTSGAIRFLGGASQT